MSSDSIHEIESARRVYQFTQKCTTTLCIIAKGSLLAEPSRANYKVVYAKIDRRHINYPDLFTDRNLVLSSKRLIRKTNILRRRRLLSGGLVSLVKVHSFVYYPFKTTVLYFSGGYTVWHEIFAGSAL